MTLEIDMKPTPHLSAIAALVLAAIGGNAFAQSSSVTLFGVVDAGVRQVKNGDSDMSLLGTNGLNSSRLGVRGTEDLGGGLFAGFWLEHGFNPDTGTQSDSTRFWNRRATVSLGSASIGEIRLGRDYSPTYGGWSDFDVFGDNGVAAGGKFASALGSTADTNTRADNLVQYFLPSGLGGFYGNVGVAAGEGVSGKKYYGGRAGYAAGKLNVSLAYGETTVTANAFGEDKLKVADAGASYDFGVVKLSGYVLQQKYGSLKLEVASLGVGVPLGAGTIRAAYTQANASGTTAAGIDTSANDGKQFALGYVYDLSKRTALYATAARVENDGAATFAVATTPALLGGQNSSGYEVGLRHRF
jgi:predicted porin